MKLDEEFVFEIKEFLNLLSDDIIKRLTKTITLNLMEPHSQSREECILAIIQHSSDIKSILRRKLINCKILFQYLHQKGLSVLPTSRKSDLINTTLEYWKSYKSQNSISEIDEYQPLTDYKHLFRLGEEFAKWFYPLFNNKSLCLESFWDNCDLKLIVEYRNDTYDFILSGPEGVVNGMYQLVDKYNIILHPNVVCGVSVEMDEHGLVVVNVNGTVNTATTCDGIFKHMFALSSDPCCSGDWKIKRCLLFLLKANSEQMDISFTNSAICD